MKIKRALVSVSDKTGLEDLVKVLDKYGVEILSTGGTAKAIRALGISINRWYATIGGAVVGFMLDAQSSTPLLTFAVTGALVGYICGRLGEEGIGDLDGAAWWSGPIVGSLGIVISVLAAMCVATVFGDGTFWRGNAGASMVVNMLLAALLVRPLGRFARWAIGDDMVVHR